MTICNLCVGGFEKKKKKINVRFFRFLYLLVRLVDYITRNNHRSSSLLLVSRSQLHGHQHIVLHFLTSSSMASNRDEEILDEVPSGRIGRRVSVQHTDGLPKNVARQVCRKELHRKVKMDNDTFYVCFF
jgi:hypothetical protein